ncbi:MAG: hypothetical protein NZ583_02400 [Desulfobacterota bacterium]|nr:hypothetical protein [Thermodesulfobacteriota bacterium]MDW8001736.1 hypothetical protein [Deltaproteobacteria bacterium]
MQECSGSKCVPVRFQDRDFLQEISYMRNRSLEDLLRRIRYSDTSLGRRANAYREKRLTEIERKKAEYEEKLKKRNEELALQSVDWLFEGEDAEKIAERIRRDRIKEELEREIRRLKYEPKDITQKDLEDALKEYIDLGDIQMDGDTIKITPKGARKLAQNVLRKILEKLTEKGAGVHRTGEIGFGIDLSFSSRPYEIGDEYERIDIERTLLNALERQGIKNRLSFQLEDFYVYEEIEETRMVSGLIIDESGSMSGDKMNAAIDTSLALAELIKREPKDLLKVYLFSTCVREIPYYDILNVSFAGGSTDIRAAMRAFRKAVANEKGDKQAYLITDTEPNTEDGKYVGFSRAIGGVIQEALYYRQSGITLNIIMLDESYELKEFASILARKNLGRVFFTSPLRLGEMVIEDYLKMKKRAFKNY